MEHTVYRWSGPCGVARLFFSPKNNMNLFFNKLFFFNFVHYNFNFLHYIKFSPWDFHLNAHLILLLTCVYGIFNTFFSCQSWALCSTLIWKKIVEMSFIIEITSIGIFLVIYHVMKLPTSNSRHYVFTMW